MSDPRLYIATRDPRIKGGVPTMARFVYEVADEGGYDPCLIANTIDKEADIRLTNLHNLRSNLSTEHTTEEGMEVKLIPRIFPEIEITQYVLNQRLWKEALQDGDVFYGVGGINQCCLTLVRENCRFGAWIATTLWEDRKPRLASSSALHRLRDTISKPFLEHLESKVFSNTTDLFVLSHDTKRNIVRAYDVAATNVTVVPYPVDTTRFTPAGNRVESPATVLFVGRINDERKNVELLVKAFAQVVETIPDARLKLVGEKPSSGLEQLVDTVGLSKNVEFVDFVPNDELPEHYRGADVFCIPSNQEGLAIVGLEAMACGTPVVSTKCGGPEDYLHDGQNGFLVPQNDVASLAERLTVLLQDDETRRAFGENARETIESDYGRSAIRNSFLESFERIQGA